MNTNNYVTLLQMHIICILASSIAATVDLVSGATLLLMQ
jgi:hypothetical protein